MTRVRVSSEGGLKPSPIDLKSRQNHVFSAFEADFCSKNKNSPPPLGLAMKSSEELAVIWTTKLEFFIEHHLKLLRKTDWILVKIYFF